jgi:lysophospholipase L1-like esterase
MRLRLAVWHAAIMTLLALGGCAVAAVPLRAAPKAVTPTRVPVVMILGDSYTTGAYDIPPEGSYAAETARLLGWQVIVGGHSGTGFVAPGRIGKTFPVLFDQQFAWRPGPDLLLVSGGHNDWPYPASMAGVAARQLFSRVKQHWPNTKLVLVGPIWGSDPAPPEAQAVRDSLRSAAKDLRVPFIDPLGEQWVTGERSSGTGNAERYILPDGTHPNAEGHRYLATRLADALRVLKLAQPIQEPDENRGV